MSARLSTLVLALAGLTLLLCTKDRPDSWADGSRLGTIQGLVEQGTLALDDTDFFWQGDKVLIDGHYYSHQPPMQALVGALPYAALHHGLGRGISDPFTYRAITWFSVGLPVLAGLWALSRLLAGSGCGPRWAAGWLAIAYFATLLLPYSLVLNQHGAAAGLTLLGLLAATRGRAVAAGVVMSLAATIDLTAAFPAVALLWPLARAGGPGAVLRYALAALPLLGLHLGINQAIAGDLRPLGMHTEAFAYPLSPFLIMSLTGGGAGDLPGEQLLYVRGALFGQSGIFSNQPVLLLGVLAGLALLVRRPQSRLPAGVLPTIGLSSLAIAAYYLTQSRNFGGSATGMRWFAVFAPLLVLPAAAWQGSVDPPARRGPGTTWLVALLALWSAGTATVGAAQPWSKFAWSFSQTRAARLEPGKAAPPWSAHLRAEWRRISAFQQAFDRPSYEALYQELIHSCGRVYAAPHPQLDAAEESAYTQRGLETLHSVLRQLERDPRTATLQGFCHFWLGKICAKRGDVPKARQHLENCLKIITAYGPALKAMQELPPVRRPG